MNVREWKRIAEKEVLRDGDRRAFMKGVEDAGGLKTERYLTCRRWVNAVDAVCAFLREHDPEKERFFRAYYGIGAPRIRCAKDGTVAVSMQLNVSRTTVYQWRGEVMTLVLLAAVQNGLFNPLCIKETNA